MLFVLLKTKYFQVWSFLQGKIEDYDPFNDYEVQIEVDGVQCILDILDGTIGQVISFKKTSNFSNLFQFFHSFIGRIFSSA